MLKVAIKLILLILFISCQKQEYLSMSLTPLLRGTVMDPTQIYFLNEYYILENLTVRLVEMDANSGYKLMLASKIEQVSDREYRIEIKETSFSNGELINISDVKNSLIRAQNSANSHVAFRELVENITLVDNKLVIRLKKRVNDFYYLLSLADLSILHSSQSSKKELLVEDWEKVSSGPFSYYIDGSEVFLLKNPFYKLSPSTYPDKIKLSSSRDRDSYLDFKNKIVDFGEFNLNSYDKHLSELSSVQDLQVIGNNGDMINYLALNSDHPKFKSLYNRKWLQKKMILSFGLDSKYRNVARKAFQFFTPLVRGFVEEEKMLAEVNSWTDVDTTKIPKELVDGITISTYQRAFEVTLKGAFLNLDKVLGIPVRLENNIASTDYQKFISKRDFEVFLGITSMDQVIVGEAINLKYFSSTPLFKDPSKKIHSLMNDYQHSEPSNTITIVNALAVQMLRDAECIPMFYVASPFFYNEEKVDVSALDEMTYFNLWKVKEK